MDTNAPSRAARIVATLVIIFVLALQAQAVFPLRRVWPFLDYPMYRTAHYAGEAVPRFHILVTTDSGATMEMDPASLGISFFKHLHGPVEAMQEGDHERFEEFVEIFEARQEVAVASARLENRPVRLDESGTVSEEPPVTITEMARHGDDGGAP